jgi:hypothetical protein
MGKSAYDFYDGQIVLIGDKQKRHGCVLRTKAGDETAALKALQFAGDEQLRILAVDFMSSTAVDEFRSKHQKSGQFGYWFKLTPTIAKTVRRLNRQLETCAQRAAA